ncbi:MAG: Crp/Fnr family transcriptional regulator [Deinococcota bacterium]
MSPYSLEWLMLYPQEFSNMRDALNRWVTLTDHQWDTLASIFHVQHVAARSMVLQPGDDTHDLFFVHKGLLRFFYPADNGQEANKAFIAEGEFAGALAASALNLPVIYGIEALEDTTLLVTPVARFTDLFDEHPVFDRLGRKLTELLLVRKEKRTRSFMQQSAGERYLEFITEHPDLAARVPQYHIASYLGITEVSLSRLKKGVLEQASST